jgi:hypothetical protein
VSLLHVISVQQESVAADATTTAGPRPLAAPEHALASPSRQIPHGRSLEPTTFRTVATARARRR